MNANRPSCYCRCGTRLARDNPSGQCGACQTKARDLMIESPDVPDEFWDTEQFRDAFAAQHIGQVSRAYRKHPQNAAHGKDGIPQKVVAGWLGLTQAQISRIENGPPVKHLDSLAHWARTFRIPEHLLWFKLPGGQPSGERTRVFEPGVRPVPIQTQRPAGALSAMPLELALPFANSNGYASAMQSFRAADRQVGGGHLYATEAFRVTGCDCV